MYRSVDFRDFVVGLLHDAITIKVKATLYIRVGIPQPARKFAACFLEQKLDAPNAPFSGNELIPFNTRIIVGVVRDDICLVLVLSFLFL